MAKITKSQDTANWRKGKDLQIGDLVAVKWDGMTAVEFSPVSSYEGKVPHMGASQHKFVLANGKVKILGGGEFVQGRF